MITVIILGVEILQFVFLTGSSDIDDLILNVGGAMTGYGLIKMPIVSKILSHITFGVWKNENNNIKQEILPLNTRICEIEEFIIDDLSEMTNIIGKFRDSLDIYGNLIKISLIYCKDECYVAFVIHHLIIDGVSWSILIDDLTYILNQKAL